MADIITSDVLDPLVEEETAFHELSMSRLGLYGDEALYQMILEELKERGLAEDSRDGVSVPMHPKVRSLILVLLSQILRPYGSSIDANLSPATDMGPMVAALSEFLSLSGGPSIGHVVEFDLNTVTVDVGSMPLNEVLDFRQQNLDAHRRYMLSVRRFVMELSRTPEQERALQFELRQAELDDLANDLRKRGRQAWKKPSSFALTLVGSAISTLVNPFTGILSLVEKAVGYEKQGPIEAGAYSYLFRAQKRFGDY